MIVRSLQATLALAAFTMLGACASESDEIGPGGATEDEAKALDEAAEMIEQTTMAAPGDESTSGDTEARKVREPSD